MPAGERAQCREMLSELITGSLFPHPSRSFQHYEPARHPTPRRLAAYSANLVLALVLIAGEVSATEFCGTVDAAKKWPQYGYLWRSAFTSSEWNSLTDVIRARASRRDGTVEIRLTRENGSAMSPTDSLIITEQSAGLTNFDVHLSAHEEVTYEAEIPFSSTASRVFRDIAFTPSWHTGMLLLQTIPFIRALGGEIRFQLNDGVLRLPGYMLTHLDYTRGASPEDRARLYDSYADAMADSPELREQLLTRLWQDLPAFPAETVVRILQKVNTVPPTETYIAIANHLWQRPSSQACRASLTELVLDIRVMWPGVTLKGLDRELLRSAGLPQDS
jgi:hypothetical protein